MALNMIDLSLGEELFPLSALPKILHDRKILGPRRGGGKLAIQTLVRWATTGTKDGVQLEVARVGSVLNTSVEAVSRFITECTNAGASESQRPAKPQPKRTDTQETTASYLASQGI